MNTTKLVFALFLSVAVLLGGFVVAEPEKPAPAAQPVDRAAALAEIQEVSAELIAEGLVTGAVMTAMLQRGAAGMGALEVVRETATIQMEAISFTNEAGLEIRTLIKAVRSDVPLSAASAKHSLASIWKKLGRVVELNDQLINHLHEDDRAAALECRRYWY